MKFATQKKLGIGDTLYDYDKIVQEKKDSHLTSYFTK